MNTKDITSWLRITDIDGIIIFDVRHWSGHRGWEIFENGNFTFVDSYADMMLSGLVAYGQNSGHKVTGWYADEFYKRFGDSIKLPIDKI